MAALVPTEVAVSFHFQIKKSLGNHDSQDSTIGWIYNAYFVAL